MKRPNVATAPQEDALARKRALIRSLIEQHGWASTPIAVPRNEDAVEPQVARANIIPFPTLRK